MSSETATTSSPNSFPGSLFSFPWNLGTKLHILYTATTLLYKRDDDAHVLARAWVFLRVLARNLSIAKRENFKRFHMEKGRKNLT